jgi:Glycosyltransferase family 87
MARVPKLKSDWLSGNRELLLVLLSVLIQLPLAYFLGHYFDQRIFMATGYVINSGANPYNPIELIHVFSNPLLNGVISPIGYPPPWPLMLGLAYRFSYNTFHDVFAYNFAIKIPIIAANVALAYLVRNLLLNLQVEKKKSDSAWLFLLFNPFMLLTTSAWGQIDSISALLCVASLYELGRGYSKSSGFLLGASIAVKPVAVPLVPLPLAFTERSLSRRKLWFLLVFLVTAFAFWVAPFLILGWSMPIATTDITNRFGMAGGLTIFNVLEIVQGSPLIPSSMWFLGYLWLPALLVGYYFVYRNPPRFLEDLVCQSVGLMLIVFLTRSWLSEPNINLILPLVLISATLNRTSRRNLHLIWIIPLLFMVVNTSFPQLFFLLDPSVLDSIAQFDAQFGTVRLAARFAVAVVWSVVAWKVAVEMLRKSPNHKLSEPQ